MPTSPIRSLDDRYRLTEGTIYLTGIQALGRLPVDQMRADRRQGRRTAAFVSGYEGSPLGGYDLELMRRAELLAEHDVVFSPAVNEELAVTAVQGSQLARTAAPLRYDGVVGIWYGKSPGLDRATDAFRHSNLMGTDPQGGALALVGDDTAAKSSTVPGASEHALADLGMPTLYPADSQDLVDYGLHGIALSRASGLWAALKVVTNVADGASMVEVGPGRVMPQVPTLDGNQELRHRPTAKMLQPMVGELERSMHEERLSVARAYAASNALNRGWFERPGDRVGIIAAGKVWNDVRQALRKLGLDDAALLDSPVRLLKMGLIHPLEPGIVRRWATGLREIIVVEEKRSFLEAAVRDELYGLSDRPEISGKRSPDRRPLLPQHAELNPDVVAAALHSRLRCHEGVPQLRDPSAPRRSALEITLPPRTPYFCSGCPHNRSTQVPDGSLVGAGIGCHTMAMLMDPDRFGSVTGLTQMGAEGTQWIGMAPFVEAPHLIQNLGDGTFHHSGSLAIRAAVAAGVDITYKLLYNSAVAMTGGQPTVGSLSLPAITHLLAAEGVARIIVTTDDPKRLRRARLAKGVEVWPRERLTEAHEALARVPGVTVLIHDQECAAALRRKRKRGQAPDPEMRVFINERVCEGCGDCGTKSNCLSVVPVDTEFGRKTQIHQTSCNKDYSCLDGDCPSFITAVPAKGRARRKAAPTLGAEDLPPPPENPATDFTVRITGVGGSGVVTVAQILGTAASLAGRHVRALDQTGLAQKGGAVVSDLKVTAEPAAAANKLAAGECDLYLGCDLLVAGAAPNLDSASQERTVAVVSTTEVATGAMVSSPAVTFPDREAIVESIRQSTRGDRSLFMDASATSSALFNDETSANILLLGAAYQTGAIPVPADAIEQAIRLNGAQVDTNIQAFRRGRQSVADPGALAKAARGGRQDPDRRVDAPKLAQLTGIVQAPPESRLGQLVARRVEDLVGYQGIGYAEEYAQFVEHVRTAEARAVPGSAALAEAVAFHLHKLMAYKDEYEVARLSLDPELNAHLEQSLGGGARIAYNLHPPFLRALGLKRKIRLRRSARPIFVALRAARRLRGTRLDLFGYARMRRMERQLIGEYRQTIADLLDALAPDDLVQAVAVAELPDMIRGYEEIKLRNVERYREELATQLAALAGAEHAA